MALTEKQLITVRVAESLDLAVHKLENSGHAEAAGILKEIFSFIDKGTPFCEDVEKENRRLWEESKTYKMAYEMQNLWRQPSISISAEALRKFGIDIV